jgi:cytoskeletal protein RodZ
MKKSKRVEVEDQPAESVVDAESFGTWLRRQRQGRDIGLREICEQSKISIRYLQALEAGRFDVLPAPVFAKGFLRQYSRYVGLDSEEVVNAYLAAKRSSEEEESLEDSPPQRSRHRRGMGWLVALVVVLVVLAAALVFLWGEWWGRRQSVGDQSAVVSGAETQLPVSQPPGPRSLGQMAPIHVAPAVTPEVASAGGVSALPSEPAAPLVVDIDFTGECWIKARVDGRKSLSETRVQGETIQLLAEKRVELTLGDSSVVSVEVNGYPMQLIGQPGAVRNVVIDLETARGLESGFDS